MTAPSGVVWGVPNFETGERFDFAPLLGAIAAPPSDAPQVMRRQPRDHVLGQLIFLRYRTRVEDMRYVVLLAVAVAGVRER